MDEAPPDQPPSAAAKARLRASLRAQRADLDRDAVARASARVCLHLAALPEFTAAATVGLYWPTRGELDPNDLAPLQPDRAKHALPPRPCGASATTRPTRRARRDRQDDDRGRIWYP